MSKGKIVCSYCADHSRKDVLQFVFRLLGIDGGPGSGNFGHAGRPGKRGGSAKGSGGSVFRSGSKETGYSSFAKQSAFRGILSAARASGSYHEFVDNMSETQANALREQRAACGTRENMQKYAERVYAMLHSRNAVSDVRQKSKLVEGKDISQSFKWNGETYTGKFGQVIDTQIEAVIDAQGFNGVPKVVSQIEMNRIIKEHPEMPILFRAYAASSPEELKKYDEMLEKGEWYVDCGTGGAQYGQGMYCAGVYPKDPLREWDDPDQDLDDTGYTVVTIRGEGYKALKVNEDDFTTPTDLIADYPYIIVDPNGERHVVMLDSESMLYENLKDGSLYDEKELGDLMYGSEIWECTETDVSGYVKTEEEARKRGIDKALDEMQHYRNLSVRRIESTTLPVAPEGKIRCDDNDGHFYYFDKKDEKAFGDEHPTRPGELISIRSSELKTEGYLYKVADDGNGVVTIDGRYHLSWDELEPTERWSYVEGKCEKPNINPKATTRMMTLDPSAKIITYKEAQRIIDDGYSKEQMQERYHDEFDVYSRELDSGTMSEDEKFILRYACMGSLGEYTSSNAQKYIEIADRMDEGRRKELLEAGHLKGAEIYRKVSEEGKERAKKFIAVGRDVGVCMALLGYDAINAEGHGESDSYTVVLNRSKVILSEDEA